MIDAEQKIRERHARDDHDEVGELHHDRGWLLAALDEARATIARLEQERDELRSHAYADAALVQQLEGRAEARRGAKGRSGGGVAMTNDEEEGIRGRLSAATPGPWRMHHASRWADVDFLMHAHADIDALLAALDEARAIIARLEAEEKRLHFDCRVYAEKLEVVEARLRVAVGALGALRSSVRALGRTEPPDRVIPAQHRVADIRQADAALRLAEEPKEGQVADQDALRQFERQEGC